MDIADYYYHDWGCLVDFFAIWVEKLQAWAAGDWTHNPLDLCSQSGVYDLSATATPGWEWFSSIEDDSVGSMDGEALLHISD